MSLTRRKFLYYTGPLLALPVLPKECSSLSDDYRNSTTPFVHGVASGDPQANRVVLWTRVSGDQKSPSRAVDTRLIGRDQQVADPCNAPAINDPGRQLLGDTQEKWFFSELESSAKRGTRWRVVGQQVMFGQLVNVLAPGACVFNPDQWDGYAAARVRVLNELVSKQIGNVAILTGDIHSSWGNDIASNPFDPSAYDRATGKGSVAVEFVTPAVTSPGIGDPAQAALLAGVLRQTHPHIKFVDLSRRGYALLDVTAERIQCEWYHVATIEERSSVETLAATLQVKDGENRLSSASEPTLPRANAAAFAPGSAVPAQIAATVTELRGNHRPV